MERKNFFYTILILFCCCTRLIPQPDSQGTPDSSMIYTLSDVVVSATKTSTSTLELANSITVIDSDEIANRNKINVFELLKTEHGLSYTTQGPLGTLSNINIRGGNNGNTLVLVDGMKLNLASDPANVYDFANLTTDNIDKIEVLRGPQSTLYGSDALSGIINIITKKGSGKSRFNLISEGGSYNTFKIAAGFSGETEMFNYNLSAGRVKSDGFSAASEKLGNNEKDGYDGNSFTSRFGINFNEDSYLDLYIRFIKSNADYDQNGGAFGDDPTYQYDQEEFVTRAESGFKLFDGLWDQKIGFGMYKNVRKYNYDSTLYNPVSSRSLYEGKRFKLDWLNNIMLSENQLLTFGLDAELDQSATRFYSLSSFGPYESIIPKSDVKIFGAYLQDQIKIEESFFATAGIRFDNHDKFGTAITYRLSPAFIIWQTGTKLKATLGTGFKAPSIFYLYDGLFGNENLNPEKSFGWDIGLEQFFWSSGISLGLTYFNNTFTDLIGLDNNLKAININKAVTSGLEIFASVKMLGFLLIKANYTFLETEDQGENSEDKNKPLLRRPKHKAAIYIKNNFFSIADISLEILYNGKRDDKDFSTFPATRVAMPSYVLVNVGIRVKTSEWLVVTGRVDNLFGKYYEDIFGYTAARLSGYFGINVTL